MTDRSRRVRRQLSDVLDDFSEDSDIGSGEDYDPRRADSMRRAGRYESSAASTPASSRPRRAGASAVVHGSSASVQRGPGTDDRRQSLKLTVKAPPSKLREVMRANELDSLQDTLGGGQVLEEPRASRRSAAVPRAGTRRNYRPTYREYGESDVEDDDDDEDEEDEDDDDEDEEEEEEEEEEITDFDRLGAEPEGGTDDEDVEMEDAPPPPRRHVPPKPPKITLKPPTVKPDGRQVGRPKLIVTPANVGPLKSVEDQEMEDDPDDDEVDTSSDLSDEEDETLMNVNEEDAEGEVEEDEDEEEVEVEEEDAVAEDVELEEEDDDLDDSDDETPGSGTATPDVTRMTKRQRNQPDDQGTLMALDMAPQQRKFFTDAEKAMKKDEHARKRKELTKRKVDEEKTAALNRLLKPQASKARGAAPKPETLAAAAAAAAAVGSPWEDDEPVQRAHPVYSRYISTKDGAKLGVPEEWLGKGVGRYFGASNTNVFVQEVE